MKKSNKIYSVACHLGIVTVVSAMGAGKVSAKAIDEALSKYGISI